MGLKVANNAFGTLNAGITSSSTTIVLNSGEGARFPTLGAGDYFYATLIDTSNNLEIVKVTARSTDTMTVVRAQDNTTARAYSTNDRFELRPTAALFNEKVNKAGDTMTGGLTLGGQLNLGSTGQIVFPATQNASSDANTLDDYEEGTWTPTLGGDTTYYNQIGEYVKIGRMVCIRFVVYVNTLGTGSTTIVSGLPFTALNTGGNGNFRGAVGYFGNIAVNTINLLWTIGQNTTTMDFTTVATSGATSNGSGAIFRNGAQVQVTATYITKD